MLKFISTSFQWLNPYVIICMLGYVLKSKDHTCTLKFMIGMEPWIIYVLFTMFTQHQFVFLLNLYGDNFYCQTSDNQLLFMVVNVC